jgi:hypothetical protein
MTAQKTIWFGIGIMVGILATLLCTQHSQEIVRPGLLESNLETNTMVVFQPAIRFETSPVETVSLTLASNKLETTALAGKFEEIMKSDDVAERERMLDRLFQKWTILDAPGAAAFALAAADEDDRRAALIHVMQTWAVQDPSAALSWAKEAPFANPNEREVAMSMACTQVAKSDPQEAIRLAIAFNVDESANGLLSGLTAHWAENDPRGASDWVISIPPSEQRNSLIESVALVMFDTNPTKAAQLIQDQIPAGESQDNAVLSILSSLALRNPDAAQTWVKAFPDTPLRERALRQLDIIQNRLTDEF